MDTTIINVRKFPTNLHREVKIAAIKEGMTFRDWLIRACEEKLERSKETK